MDRREIGKEFFVKDSGVLRDRSHFILNRTPGDLDPQSTPVLRSSLPFPPPRPTPRLTGPTLPTSLPCDSLIPTPRQKLPCASYVSVNGPQAPPCLTPSVTLSTFLSYSFPGLYIKTWTLQP